jgi:hypothetical protein
MYFEAKYPHWLDAVPLTNIKADLTSAKTPAPPDLKIVSPCTLQEAAHPHRQNLFGSESSKEQIEHDDHQNVTESAKKGLNGGGTMELRQKLGCDDVNVYKQVLSWKDSMQSQWNIKKMAIGLDIIRK